MFSPRICILLLWSIFLSIECYSNVRIAVSSGKWEHTSTWKGGKLPACDDTIIIGKGLIIQLSSDVDFSHCGNAMVIQIAGVLNFQHGKTIKLSCYSNLKILAGGQLNIGKDEKPECKIIVCNETVWKTNSGNLTGPVSYTSPNKPIDLGYFGGYPGREEIVLKWITYAEKSKYFFTIEKGKDGIHFKELTMVEGGGIAPILNSYTTIDYNPFEGIQYYRLRQTDHHGKFTLSPIIVINYSSEKTAKIYPNPTSGELFTNVHPDLKGETAQLIINKSDGKIHLQKEIFINGDTHGIKLLQTKENLKPGSYLVSLNFREQSFSEYIISR